MRSITFHCFDCPKKLSCIPALWHWEGNSRVIDADGTLCILPPTTPKENTEYPFLKEMTEIELMSLRYDVMNGNDLLRAIDNELKEQGFTII